MKLKLESQLISFVLTLHLMEDNESSFPTYYNSHAMYEADQAIDTHVTLTSPVFL